jgi:hypothetical protein
MLLCGLLLRLLLPPLVEPRREGAVESLRLHEVDFGEPVATLARHHGQVAHGVVAVFLDEQPFRLPERHAGLEGAAPCVQPLLLRVLAQVPSPLGEHVALHLDQLAVGLHHRPRLFLDVHHKAARAAAGHQHALALRAEEGFLRGLAGDRVAEGLLPLGREPRGRVVQPPVAVVVERPVPPPVAAVVLDHDAFERVVRPDDPAAGLEVGLERAEHAGEDAVRDPGGVDPLTQNESVAEQFDLARPRALDHAVADLAVAGVFHAVKPDALAVDVGGRDAGRLELLGEPPGFLDAGGEQDRGLAVGVQPLVALQHPAEEAGQFHVGPAVVADTAHEFPLLVLGEVVAQGDLHGADLSRVRLVRAVVFGHDERPALPQFRVLAGLDQDVVHVAQSDRRGRRAEDHGPAVEVA